MTYQSNGKNNNNTYNKEKHIYTNRVISNIDVPSFETSSILPNNQKDTNIYKYRSSISVLSIHFAFSMKLTCLDHHTLFFSEDYDDSWECVEKSWREDDGRYEYNPSKSNFYVHAPSRTDNSDDDDNNENENDNDDNNVCPSGHDAITVLIPIPLLPLTASDNHSNNNNNNNNDSNNNAMDETFVKNIRIEVLQRLSKAQGISSYSELEEYIVAEKCRTAESWQQVSLLSYTYIYIYIYIHLYTHAHTHTYIYIYTYIHIYIYTYIHIYIYTYMYIYMYIYISHIYV